MGQSKYIIREDAGTTGTWWPNGDNISISLDYAPENRIPEDQGCNAGSDRDGREGGRSNESLRTIHELILPIREGTEGIRIKGPKENYASGDSTWSFEGSHDAGLKGTEVWACQGRADTTEKSQYAKRWKAEEHRYPMEKEEDNCFINRDHPCDDRCHAYEVELKEPCKILNYLSKLALPIRVPDYRTTLPPKAIK